MKQSPRLLQSIRFDIIAGLIAAAIVLPKALAYASVAGLPVSVGLYTAFVPMIVYALLGTSCVLSVSSTTTLAILTATELEIAVPDGDAAKLVTATATLVVMTGALLAVASVLRLGFLANFISRPVLTGFKAGIGLVILLDQVPKLLGLHITKSGFFHDLLSVVLHLSDTPLTAFAVGASALLILVILEWRFPHSPAPLAVVAAGIATSWAFTLTQFGVSTVGFIPQSLPSLTIPSLHLVQQLLPGAIGIALMSYTETIAAGRAFANETDRRIDSNRELLATGLANVAGGFFGAMPAGGGTSQTAVVRAAGGRSQMSSLIVAAASAATMLVLAPILGVLPQPILAAVVIIYSVGLISPAEFVDIGRIRRMELTWGLAALIAVLIFGTLQGILVAIVLSLLALSFQAANPNVYVIARKSGADVLRPLTPDHPDDELMKGLLVVRPEGRIFFANAQLIGDQIRELVRQYQPEVLTLDMSRVPDIEYTALRMLIEAEKRMESEGVTVWLAALNPPVLACIRASSLHDRLGRERMLFNARAAFQKFARREQKRDKGAAFAMLEGTAAENAHEM
jgi:sulfate permease, SulP family